MNCPICGVSPTQDADAALLVLSVNCPQHGNFRVARAAARRLAKLDRGARELALVRASTFTVQRGDIIITKLDV